MRKPATASISKTTLLELEIQLEKARSRRLSAETEAALLQRIRQGDAGAVPLLVDSWQVQVFSIVRQYLTPNTRIAPIVAAARQALTRLAESELNATRREPLLRFGPFAVRQAIMQELGKMQLQLPILLPDSENETHEVLAVQMPALNKLNDLLLQQEIQIAATVAERLIQLHQQAKHTPHQADEVDTEAIVLWYLKDEKAPVHECWLSFRYRDVCMENKMYPLLSGTTTAYHKSHLPPLSQPYCFLLYHLLEKARPRLYTLLSSIAVVRVQVEGGNEWTVDVE